MSMPSKNRPKFNLHRELLKIPSNRSAKSSVARSTVTVHGQHLKAGTNDVASVLKLEPSTARMFSDYKSKNVVNNISSPQ